MSSWKCPFCKVPLFSSDGGKTYKCSIHGLTLDSSTGTASIDKAAPIELYESFKFLEEFFSLQPMFAVGPQKLFEPGFNSEDVLYYTEKDIPKRIIKPSQVRDKHLLAGAGLIAKGLLRSCCFGYHSNLPVSPLTPISNTAGHWLFDYVALTTAKVNTTVPVDLHAYLQPTLEGMSCILLHMPFSSIEPLTNETVLYSAIFMQPQLNIKWDTNNLAMAVKRFIYSLTEFTPTTKHMPFNLKECLVNYPESFLSNETNAREVYTRLLKANFSTAVNEGASGFDILDKKYVVSLGPGKNKITSKEIKSILDSYGILEELFNKYAAPVTPMGIEAKRKYLSVLDNQTTADDVVLSFWNKVFNELKKEVK